MVEIAPFKGMVYNKEKIKKLDDVMSPPYDIISEDYTKRTLQKNEYNFVKLILGKISPMIQTLTTDTQGRNNLFDAWQQQGILVPST